MSLLIFGLLFCNPFCICYKYLDTKLFDSSATKKRDINITYCVSPLKCPGGVAFLGKGAQFRVLTGKETNFFHDC